MIRLFLILLTCFQLILFVGCSTPQGVTDDDIIAAGNDNVALENTPADVASSNQATSSSDDELSLDDSSSDMSATSQSPSDELSLDDSSLDDSTMQASNQDQELSEDDVEKDLDFGDAKQAEQDLAGTDMSGSQGRIQDKLNDQDFQEDTVTQEPPVKPLPDDTVPPVAPAPLENGQAAAAPESPATPAPAPTAPLSPVENAPVTSQMVDITDIRYLANQAGGTVEVDASGPLTYQTRVNPDTNQFVIEIANANLPDRLKRPYILKDFQGAFGSINAYQDPGETTARVVVQLKNAAQGQPIVQTEGDSLVVIPSSSPMIAKSETPPPAAAANAEKDHPLQAHTLDEFLTGNQKFYGRPISIQTKGADVRDIINFLADQSGANIVMSDDVKGNLSVKLRKVPWDQALVTIMRAKALGYVRQGNVIRISTLKELRAESEATATILKNQRVLAPVRVKVIPVNFADVDDLEKQVKAFLSKDGKVVVDKRSNTILLTDREDVLKKVTKIIHALDIQPNQVLIEGKIVEAFDSLSSFVGINWNMTGAAKTISNSGGANGVPITITPDLGVSTFDPSVKSYLNTGLRIGTLDFFGDLNASLALAEQDSLAHVVSSPRIVTMNREKAQISQAGEQVSIVTTEDPQSHTRTTQDKHTPVTLDLSVTPQITSDGSIIMAVQVKRQFVGAVVEQTTQARPINTRTAQTKVLVRNGQTAVIGGIYQSDETTQVNGIPGLKDIPVIGWLFKSRSKGQTKNELLIFLTPRIMTQALGDGVDAGSGTTTL